MLEKWQGGWHAWGLPTEGLDWGSCPAVSTAARCTTLAFL